MASEGLLEAYLGSQSLSGVSESPERHRTGPGRNQTGPQRPQIGPKRPLTGPWRPQTGTRRPQTGPGRAQAGPGRPLTGPKRVWTGTGRPQTGPGRPQTGPGGDGDTRYGKFVLCGSIGHRLLRGRCPKRKSTMVNANKKSATDRKRQKKTNKKSAIVKRR